MQLGGCDVGVWVEGDWMGFGLYCMQVVGGWRGGGEGIGERGRVLAIGAKSNAVRQATPRTLQTTNRSGAGKK